MRPKKKIGKALINSYIPPSLLQQRGGQGGECMDPPKSFQQKKKKSGAKWRKVDIFYLF